MPNWWDNIGQDPGFGDPKFLKKADAAKKKAWTNFLNHFPKADKSRFVSQENIDEKNNATAEVFFKESEGSLQSVFGSDRKYSTPKSKPTSRLTSISQRNSEKYSKKPNSGTLLEPKQNTG